MKTPKNQHEQVLWYLINYNFWFSLKTVIVDSMFYKFQTRLSELEQRYGVLAERKQTKFENRFGRKANYTSYRAIDIDKLKNIYNGVLDL